MEPRPHGEAPEIPASAPVSVRGPAAIGETAPRVAPARASATVARRRLAVPEAGRVRAAPPSGQALARRRRLLLWTKWLLPLAALVLLGSIAMWPELDRSSRSSRIAFRQAANVDLETGRMTGARYHGIDAHGRPYMITSDETHQLGADRFALDHPVADSLTSDGKWVLVRARSGVYMPHAQMLDLFDDVVFYRDDGTLMRGPTATIDIKRGILASDQWVHAEGPFGVLDAQGELMSQHDGILQLRGPARMILNDDHFASASAAPAPSRAGSR